MSVEAIIGWALMLLMAAGSHWLAASKLSTRMETQLQGFQTSLGELKADVHSIRGNLDLLGRHDERLNALASRLAAVETRVVTLEGRRTVGG